MYMLLAKSVSFESTLLGQGLKETTKKLLWKVCLQIIRCGGGGLVSIWMDGWSCESAFECFNKFEDEIMPKKKKVQQIRELDGFVNVI